MRDLDLRGLRIRLLRGGVAPRHVNRTLKELRHHFADLEQKALSQGLSQLEASAQAAERIGDPELVIDEALSRPELRSWAYRWPWGVYGILPVVTMALVIVGSMFAVFGFLELAQNLSGLSDAALARALFDQSWVRAFFEIWPVVMVYVLPGIFAGTLCIFAANRDAPILWPTVGVFLVLILGFSYNLGVTPSLASDQNSWNIGVGIGFSTDWFLSIRILRLLIPLVLVLGPYYWWRQRQREAILA